MKVLITRDTTQAGGLKSKLAEEGITVICVPTISIQDPDDWGIFDQATKQIDQYNWLLFTSSNAVKQTAKRLKYHSISDKTIGRLKICVVGDQTAKAVEDCGWLVEFVPSQFQAEGVLAELLKRGVKGEYIWFPRAEKAREFLVPELEAAGAIVDLTPVYTNRVPLENRELLLQNLQNNSIDWITFTSSSTVTNFFKILGTTIDPSDLPQAASIGEKTTETLRNFGLEPAFTANPQNIASLSQGIIDWGKDNDVL